MSVRLHGPIRAPLAGGTPKSIVVLLHGFGSDGNDLISLSPLWSDALPHTLFVSPHAPFPCALGPFGRQWFGLESLDPAAVLPGLREASVILDAFLDGLLSDHGLTAANLALVGFSQGAMLSLHAGLRRTVPLAGIVGYSGALYGGELLPQELKSRPPVLLVHGEEDGVIPYFALADAATRLQAVDVPVRACGRPDLAHGIDEEGIQLAKAFLATVLGKTA